MPRPIVAFPEWRPDISRNVEGGATVATQSPFLITCRNLIPRESFYELVPAPVSVGDQVPDPVLGAYTATPFSTLVITIFVGTLDALYRNTDGTTWNVATIIPDLPNNEIVSWRFTATNRSLGGYLAANDAPGELGDSRYLRVLLSNSNGTSWDEVGGDEPPVAAVIAMVGEFAVVGDGFTATGSGSPHFQANPFFNGIRWSALGNVDDWPELLSADALAKQGGQQLFPDIYGRTRYIAPLTALTALVFQQRAIHRMSYIGGDEVWQFDTLSTDIGAETRHGNVQAGGWTYIVNREGFYRTNGQAIEPIGAGKINRYFLQQVDWTKDLRICAAFDEVRSCVWWLFETTESVSRMLIFNYASSRWSTFELDEVIHLEFLYPYGSGTGVPFTPMAFNTSERITTFDDADDTLVATIRTGEENLNPAGLACIQGVRPLADLITTSPIVRVRHRMDAADSVTTTTGSINRVGEYNMRATARYHSIEVEFASASTSRISGIELNWEPAGRV